ncbi:hypothetical protein N9878_00745 [bacterium]|nr:hypothetical protein [bacterium]
MTDAMHQDLREVKVALIELTHAVTKQIVRDERREADQKRIERELSLVDKRVHSLETAKIPAMMTAISANKQIAVMATSVLSALSLGAIGMFFKMAGPG